MSILRACPYHLLQQLALLPSSLHPLALDAAFPGQVSGNLTIPCIECAISPATKALELFAALPETRQQSLSVSGVNCLVSPFDPHPVLGKATSSHEFRVALLRCCRSVRDLSLALEGEHAHLTPLLQTLASSSILRSLSLTLPSSYSFQSSGMYAPSPEDSAGALANSFAFVTGLSSLTIGSTLTPTDLREKFHSPTISCWDASGFKLLTYLSIENSGFSVCAHHFGASVARCVELTHLGVHLSLGKCVEEASAHNYGWLSRLTLLTSLTLRCSGKLLGDPADYLEEIDANIQRRNEVYWYLRLLFQECLSSLKQLKTLDIADNVLNRSLLSCIVSNVSGSLQELTVTVTIVDVKDVYCVVNLLSGAVHLSKLCLCVNAVGAHGERPVRPLQCLGMHICCLPALRHLHVPCNYIDGEDNDLEMARVMQFGHWDGRDSSREPMMSKISDLTHLDFSVGGKVFHGWADHTSESIIHGFCQASLKHLTSLRSMDVCLRNDGDDVSGYEVLSTLMPMIRRQPDLESLGLSFNCDPDDTDEPHCSLAVSYVAGLATALKRCSHLSALKLLGFHIVAEGKMSSASGFLACTHLNCHPLQAPLPSVVFASIEASSSTYHHGHYVLKAAACMYNCRNVPCRLF